MLPHLRKINGLSLSGKNGEILNTPIFYDIILLAPLEDKNSSYLDFLYFCLIFLRSSFFLGQTLEFMKTLHFVALFVAPLNLSLL